MLREVGIIPDEPRTILDLKIRDAFLRLVGREPDLITLQYFSNLISSGNKTLADIITDLSYGLDTELGQYVAQGNGNPVVNIILRDNDNIAEVNEAAFNTNLQRKADLHYVKTGDIISLPYTHAIYLQNKLASSNVNVNPYGISTFVGTLNLNPPDNSLELSPTSTPTVLNDPNDNYQSLVNSFKQTLSSKQGTVITVDNTSGFYGSYYGEWELISQGAPVLDTTDNKVKRVDEYGKFKFDFSIKPSTTSIVRSGIRNDKVYDQNLRPKMNDISIGFSARGMKPNTRVYAFFGDREVSTMCVQHNPTNVVLDIPTRILSTDSQGEIRGTFTYRESDLNFDAGVYLFHLSDSINNADNRTTYASSPFNGLGISGYDAEEFRTRIGTLSTNKTSTLAIKDPRTVIVSDGPPPPPPDQEDPPAPAEVGMDVIDFCFVYGLGRKPSQAEKSGIYDKWSSYGVSSMTTWNAIVNKNPTNDANTNGAEMWYTVGWPKIHELMTYVDRSITVVPNGSDSSDLRSKYLAAVTYPYGRWTWYYLKNEPGMYPPTINYNQLINVDQTQALTAPWETDLSYDSFNDEGLKVFKALTQFTSDVYAINNGFKASDWQGALGFYGRMMGFVTLDTDGNIVSGSPKLPKTYTVIKNIPEGVSNAHVITTVWNTIGNDCQKPYRVEVVTSVPTTTSNTEITITASLNYLTWYSYIQTDIAANDGNIKSPRGTITGSGRGPTWSVNQSVYPLTLSTGTYTADKSNATVLNGNLYNWVTTLEDDIDPTSTLEIGSSSGSPVISGTPYQLISVHYGQVNGIGTPTKVQVVMGIREGQVGLSSNLPIVLTVKNTGAFFNTWIPGNNGAAYWDDGTFGTNFIDVYPENSDPLGLQNLLANKTPFTLEIKTRTASAPPAPPPPTTYFEPEAGGNDDRIIQ